MSIYIICSHERRVSKFITLSILGHRRLANLGAGIAADTSSVVSYTTRGDRLLPRNRPLVKDIYDVAHTMPAQITLAGTLNSCQHRQQLFRLMASYTYVHTRHNGRIPDRIEMAALFEEFYESSMIPLPESCDVFLPEGHPETEGELTQT